MIIEGGTAQCPTLRSADTLFVIVGRKGEIQSCYEVDFGKNIIRSAWSGYFASLTQPASY